MTISKKSIISIILLMTLFVFPQLVSAEDNVSFEQPVMITSIGQSPDALMIKVLLKRNKIEFNYKPLASVSDIKEYKTIIFAVGASSKGMGAAGIDFNSELERTKKLLNYTEENNIPGILVHVGGQSRRGESTDELLDLVANKVDVIVITQDGDKDGFFTEKSEELNIPLKTAEKISETGKIFAEIID